MSNKVKVTKRGKHPVDRGWAWVVLLASLGSHFLAGALVYSVGILHTGLLNQFQPESVTMVAMTGAVNTGLVCIAAPIASYIINRFGCRTCCVLGGLLCFAGYTSSAFVTSVILLFFTFGLTAGVGLGLAYSSTNVTIGFYFEQHRGLASGISNSFQALGILSGSVILQALVEIFSVSGTFLLLGAVSLHFCFFGMFYRPTMYEGKTLDITVEEQEMEECMEMQPGCPDNSVEAGVKTTVPSPYHDEISRISDSEKEADPLLGQTQRHQGELLEKPVNTPNMDTEEGMGENVMLPTQQCVTVLTTEMHETSCLLGNLPPLTQDQQSDHGSVHLAVTKADLWRGQEERNGEVSDAPDATITCVSESNRQQEVDSTISDADDFVTGVPQSSVEHSFMHTARAGQQCPSPEADLPSIEVVTNHESEPVNTMTLQVKHQKECQQKCAEKRKRVCCGTYLGLLSDMAFMLHCASLFVSNVHIAGVFLHLPEYVQHHGTSPVRAAQLFLTVGCMSLLSKLSCGFATSDPNIDPLILSMGMMGLNGVITCFFPLYADSYSKQMIFSALFGLYFGGLYALINPILVRFAGVSRLADAYGISMFILGGGYLMGPTFAAMIVDAGATYGHSFLFLGIMMLSGAFLDMAAACFLQSRDRQRHSDSKVIGVSNKRQSQGEAAHEGEGED